MTPKIEEALLALAAKLGTTAEHLWYVLIKQSIFSGCLNLAGQLAIITVCLLGIRKILKKAKEPKEEYHNMSDEEGIVYIVGGTGVCCLFALFAFFSIGTSLTSIFNPEFHALKTIFTYAK